MLHCMESVAKQVMSIYKRRGVANTFPYNPWYVSLFQQQTVCLAAVFQSRCNLSAQLQSVSRVDPLPSLNSILSPKLWAVFLVATNQSMLHAGTVH